MTERTSWPAATAVLLAGVAAALHIGKLPPAVPVLQAELGISLIQAGFLLSLVQGAGMLLGIVVGTAAEGFGLKRTMVVGLVLITLASVAGGFARGFVALLLLRALEGFGVLLSSVPAPALLRRVVVPGEIKKVLGMWGAYVPFGNGLALFIGPLLIARTNWSAWWWVLAVVTAIMAVVVQLLVAPDPPRPVAQGVSTETWQERVVTTLRHRGPWLAALVFGLYASQWMAVIGFLPTIYQQAGWVGVTGALLTGIVPFMNVTGNLAAGWLLQRGWSLGSMLLGGLGGQAVGAFLAFASLTEGSPVIRYVGALIFSAVGGLVPGALFALAPETAPTATTVSTTVGWVQQLSSTGQVLGPPAVAALVAMLGGWHLAWTATLTTTIIGSILALALQRDIRARHPHPVRG